MNLLILLCYGLPLARANIALDARVSNIAPNKKWWDQHSIDVKDSDYLTDSRLFLPGPAHQQPKTILQKLRNDILALHNDANNVREPETFHLLIGSGGVQLINAAAYAVHKYLNQTITSYCASVPHYSHFRLIAKHFDGMQWLQTPDCVEWITYPNNPDGKRVPPTFQLDPQKQIYDTVYYWPSFTRDIQPISHNIMIFSLSKLSGHSSTRLGWAFVKDLQIAKHMETYIWLQTTHASLESLIASHAILSTIRMTKNEYYDHVYSQLTQRWDRIDQMITQYGTDVVENLSERGGPCLWIRCLRPYFACHSQLEKVGIVSEKGTVFGSTLDYTRMCISMDQYVFDKLIKRFYTLLVGHIEEETWECVHCQKHFVH